MKTFSLFVLIISCFVFARAADKCDYSNFSECINSINGLLGVVGTKYAEKQCPEDVCKNVRNDWVDCLEKVYNTNEYKDSFTKAVVGAVNLASISNSIICEKAGGVYCYDAYRDARKNQTLLNEFYCSKCGKKMNERYKTVLKTFTDKNSEDYKEAQKEIDQMNLCSGAFVNASIKAATFLIVGLISYLLL